MIFARRHTVSEELPFHGVACKREGCVEVLARFRIFCCEIQFAERRMVERIAGETIAVGDRPNCFDPASWGKLEFSLARAGRPVCVYNLGFNAAILFRLVEIETPASLRTPAWPPG
jgi:hypothetical protein